MRCVSALRNLCTTSMCKGLFGVRFFRRKRTPISIWNWKVLPLCSGCLHLGMIRAWVVCIGFCIALPWRPVAEAACEQLREVRSLVKTVHAPTRLYIESIHVKGNTRTKTSIVLRELDFRVGDSLLLADLQACLQRNEYHLMNTGLFNRVKLNVKEWKVPGNRLSISIEVEESWYLYPIPLFELADRNFNLWWRNYRHDFRRTNYGLTLRHSNLTGRADRFKFTAQLGFTRKFEMDYKLPFVDKAQRWGTGFNFLISDSKYLRYRTQHNREQFIYDPDKRLLYRKRFLWYVQRRPAWRSVQRWELGFYYNRIAGQIADEFNPDFLGLGRSRQRYFSLRYAFEWDSRDVRPYPRRGVFFVLSAEKQGLGVFDELQAFYVDLFLNTYFPLWKKATLESIFRTHLALQRTQQPYYNSRALGYGSDYLRGYEYYLVDGLDMAFAKWSLRLPLWDRHWSWGRFMPVSGLRQMPLRLYFTINGDVGYVNDPYYAEGNPLSNTWLWSAGIGLDVVSYYDKVVQFQLSRNGLGEVGLFLHWFF